MLWHGSADDDVAGATAAAAELVVDELVELELVVDELVELELVVDEAAALVTTCPIPPKLHALCCGPKSP